MADGPALAEQAPGVAPLGAPPALAASAAEPPSAPAGVLERLATFEDIQVLPSDIRHSTRSKRPGGLMHGGPVWPAEARDGFVRFISRREPLDRLAPPVERCDEVIEEPCVWGGYLQNHFGHLVAEHCGRLLWSRHAWPDALVLFVHEPGATLDALPRFVTEVVGWFGVRPERMRLVGRPLLARRLHVAPQAEPFKTAAPTDAYLDLLDHHVGASGLSPRPSDLLFVTRAGMLSRAKGGHVGEAYLAGRLAALGATVIDPGSLPLREQLAHYAGARHIIFAEGSAIHGRQLLGRLNQDITVLCRRPGSRLAALNLRPRCRRLTFVEATRHMVAPVRRLGPPADSIAMSIYDLKRLLRGLAALGLDVMATWDQKAYLKACRDDLAAWQSALQDRPDVFDLPASLEALSAVTTQRPFSRRSDRGASAPKPADRSAGPSAPGPSALSP